MVEALLNLVDKTIEGVIWSLGVVGFLMAAYSIGRLVWQIRLLDNDEQEIRYERLGLESSASEAVLAKLLKEKFRRIGAERRHAHMRQLALQAFQRVFQKNRNLNAENKKDVELSLPSAGDLNEMTLQTELSGMAPSSLNTIVSFLLILGICGTMSGVHVYLMNQSLEDIQDLRPALRPSMAAIICTVILIASRALYAALVDHYLLRLDEWTARFREKKKIAPVNPARDLLDNVVDRLGRLETELEGLLSSVEEWSEKDSGDDEVLRNVRALEKQMTGVRRVSSDESVINEISFYFQEAEEQLNKITKTSV